MAELTFPNGPKKKKEEDDRSLADVVSKMRAGRKDRIRRGHASGEFFIDPDRAKQIAAARAKAIKMKLFGAKNQLKIPLEE